MDILHIIFFEDLVLEIFLAITQSFLASVISSETDLFSHELVSMVLMFSRYHKWYYVYLPAFCKLV